MRNVSDVLLNEEEAELKDSVVRVFFSNFTVTADSFEIKRGYDITHKLNEPFAGFVKSDNFVRGRVEHTLHELLNHLLEHSDEAKSILDDFRKTCSPKSYPTKFKLSVVF